MGKNAAAVLEPQVDLIETYDQATVELAIEKIEKAFKFGQSTIKKHGEWLQSKANKIIPTIAAQKGRRRDSVERARQLARVFSRDEINEICDECRTHNFPLGLSLVYRALSLGASDKCLGLLRRAIRGKWTQRRMNAEIGRRPGAISRSGRPRAMPKSPTDVRRQIVSRFGPDVRWLSELKSTINGKLEASLLKKIDKAVAALEALVDAAS